MKKPLTPETMFAFILACDKDSKIEFWLDGQLLQFKNIEQNEDHFAGKTAVFNLEKVIMADTGSHA